MKEACRGKRSAFGSIDELMADLNAIDDIKHDRFVEQSILDIGNDDRETERNSSDTWICCVPTSNRNFMKMLDKFRR